MTALRIATRSSPLALWQAEHVAALLRSVADTEVSLVRVSTEGDRDQAASLAQIGGRGVFTKEVQQVVLDGRADLAVHSLKDLPTAAIPGLSLAAVPPRGPVGDVLVSATGTGFDALAEGARVGSGSLRRRAQVLHRRSDLRLVDIRGNVDSRLRRLRDGDFDAIILAAAGLERLGRSAEITEVLDPAWMVPAVGQGAIGIECRADDRATHDCLIRIDDPSTHSAVDAERALLAHLGGGCQVPLGATASIHEGHLQLRAAVLSPDGTKRVASEASGSAAHAEELGRELAERLRLLGAADFVT